jgi:hypothetical protein
LLGIARQSSALLAFWKKRFFRAQAHAKSRRNAEKAEREKRQRTGSKTLSRGSGGAWKEGLCIAYCEMGGSFGSLISAYFRLVRLFSLGGGGRQRMLGAAHRIQMRGFGIEMVVGVPLGTA